MKNALSNAFREIIANLDFPEIEILIQLPKNPEHGDFATNLALQLGGKLETNPRDIAQKLIDKLIDNYPNLVDSAEIAGPGFINISINKNAIVVQLRANIKDTAEIVGTDDQTITFQSWIVDVDDTTPLTNVQTATEDILVTRNAFSFEGEIDELAMITDPATELVLSDSDNNSAGDDEEEDSDTSN